MPRWWRSCAACERHCASRHYSPRYASRWLGLGVGLGLGLWLGLGLGRRHRCGLTCRRRELSHHGVAVMTYSLAGDEKA